MDHECLCYVQFSVEVDDCHKAGAYPLLGALVQERDLRSLVSLTKDVLSA